MRHVKGGSECGSETIQFAVAAPLLLIVLFSVVQAGGMMLAASQVASEVTRASRQMDVAGLERAADKAAFVEREVLGAATQLRAESLQVSNVVWRRKQERETGSPAGRPLEQRTSVALLAYDVSYRLPAIADLPGLTGRTLSRHVECSLVDGRVIEVDMESA